MPGNSIVFSPLSFRGFGAGGIHRVQPVVRDHSGAQQAPASRASRDDSGKTSYTPNAGTEPTPLYSPSGRVSGAKTAFASIDVESSDSFDLAIRTAEGDVATIHLSEQSRASANAAYSERARTAGFSFSSVDSVDSQIRVQGHLNADETAAINALVTQVAGVANQFFAGNTDQAFTDAAQIDISQQADTLNAFAFALQTTQSIRATSTYQDVADSTAPLQVDVPTRAPPPPPPPPNMDNGSSKTTSISNFLNNLKALLEGFTQGAKEASANPTVS